MLSRSLSSAKIRIKWQIKLILCKLLVLTRAYHRVFGKKSVICHSLDAWETNSPEFVKTPFVGAYTTTGVVVPQSLRERVGCFYNYPLHFC